MCTPLKSVLRKLFPGCSSKEDVVDGIKTEWREYQTEVIPDNHFMISNGETSGRKQVSYWEHAFEVAGIAGDEIPDGDDGKTFDVDCLILSLEKKMLVDGSIKYPKICQLFKIMASIPHGNSAPENGFSINKNMIQLHGTSIQTETIEALRLVKDTILSHGSRFDVPMNKGLFESVALAHSRYQDDLKHKRALIEAEEKEFEGRKKVADEVLIKKLIPP